MLTRRRAGGALMSVALAAGAWYLAPGSASADHGPAPSAAHYWAPGESTTTWMWRHVNVWTQPCTGRGCTQTTKTDTTECRLRAASAAAVPDEGCGHSRDGWSWAGHGSGTGDNLGEPETTCAGPHN